MSNPKPILIKNSEELIKLFGTPTAPYKGKTTMDASLIYAPYVPLYTHRVRMEPMKPEEIRFTYHRVEFNPRIKLKHFLKFNKPRNEKMRSRFLYDAVLWLDDANLVKFTDYVIEFDRHQIWFKDAKFASLFKLTFDGFDKT